MEGEVRALTDYISKMVSRIMSDERLESVFIQGDASKPTSPQHPLSVQHPLSALNWFTKDHQRPRAKQLHRKSSFFSFFGGASSDPASM